jgi:response regulator RpfG family c-di-GMP phosphodiesterase
MVKPIKIVHLDDHKLFQAGLRKCLDPETNNLTIQAFQYSDDAFLCVKKSLDANEPVDLIITDLRHLGQNGYEFAKSIRRYECSFFIRIPILLLSMFPAKSSNLIQKGLDERLFDWTLTKSATCEDIWKVVERLAIFLTHRSIGA